VTAATSESSFSSQVRTGFPSPSMRRPASVKSFLLYFLFFVVSFFKLFPLSQAASVATLPSALYVERLSLGARWVYLIQ
jgi:hypothetical protein